MTGLYERDSRAFDVAVMGVPDGHLSLQIQYAAVGVSEQ